MASQPSLESPRLTSSGTGTCETVETANIINKNTFVSEMKEETGKITIFQGRCLYFYKVGDKVGMSVLSVDNSYSQKDGHNRSFAITTKPNSDLFLYLAPGKCFSLPRIEIKQTGIEQIYWRIQADEYLTCRWESHTYTLVKAFLTHTKIVEGLVYRQDLMYVRKQTDSPTCFYFTYGYSYWLNSDNKWKTAPSYNADEISMFQLDELLFLKIGKNVYPLKETYKKGVLLAWEILENLLQCNTQNFTNLLSAIPHIHNY